MTTEEVTTVKVETESKENGEKTKEEDKSVVIKEDGDEDTTKENGDVKTEPKEEKAKEENGGEQPMETETAPVKKKENGDDSAPDSAAVEIVAERLKFFFSDANVRQDRFIRTYLLKDDKTTGYVPIDALLRFNTIKRHTSDINVVVQATKTILSDRLVLSEDETAIGRLVPFTKAMVDDNIPLSLHVANLPLTKEEDNGGGGNGHKRKGGKPQTRYACRVDEIRDLFLPYGKVALVKLKYKQTHNDGDKKKRRFSGGLPAGSAMVEFESLEGLEKAAEELLTSKDNETLVPKRELKLGDNVLSVKLLKEYVDVARKHKEEKKEREKEDDEKTKKRPLEPEKKAAAFTMDWKPGCVVTLQGLPENCDREAILAAVSAALEMDLDQVKEMKIYADYSRGQKNGAIRFREPTEHVEKLKTQLESGETKIADHKVEKVKLLEGEEETKYWNDFIEFKNKQQQSRAHERGFKKKRHRR